VVTAGVSFASVGCVTTAAGEICSRVTARYSAGARINVSQAGSNGWKERTGEHYSSAPRRLCQHPTKTIVNTSARYSVPRERPNQITHCWGKASNLFLIRRVTSFSYRKRDDRGIGGIMQAVHQHRPRPSE